MSIATVLWLLVVSGLVSGVAGTLSAAFRRAKRPERGIWILALVVTAALPLLPAPSTGPDGAARATLETTGTLPIAKILTLASASLPEPARASVPWIPILWTVASLATVVALLGGAWSLARRRERWPRRRVDGDLLRVSDRFGPAVVGWIDPEVVLPAWALDLESRQRRMILRHENEHRWAKDPQLLALGVFLLAAAPWNPFAWLQFRGLRRAVEFDCDGRVLGAGAPPRAYGRLLLSVQLDGGRGALFSPALREPASFLERRLDTMKLRDRPTPRLHVTALALVAVALTVVACEAPRPTEPGTSTDAAPTAVLTEEAGNLERSVRQLLDADFLAPVELEVDGERYRGIPEEMAWERYGSWQVLSPSEQDAPTVIRLGLVGEDAPSSEQPAGTLDSRGTLEVIEVPAAVEAISEARAKVLEVVGESGDESAWIAHRSRLEEMGYTVVETDGGVEVRYGRNVILRAPTLTYEASSVYEGSSGSMRVRGAPSDQPGEARPREKRAPDAAAQSILEGRLDGSPLIYVDGVRVGTEREPGAGMLERIRPDDIDRIEVIKGEVAETRYGVDAAGGVILIFTKKN